MVKTRRPRLSNEERIARAESALRKAYTSAAERLSAQDPALIRLRSELAAVKLEISQTDFRVKTTLPKSIEGHESKAKAYRAEIAEWPTRKTELETRSKDLEAKIQVKAKAVLAKLAKEAKTEAQTEA